MEKRKLPLRIWRLAFIFITATKKWFPCLEFQQQLGLSRYDTAFRLMHKILAIMGKRDALYTLTKLVALGEY